MKHTCFFKNCKQKIKDIYLTQHQCKCNDFYCFEHIDTKVHNCQINYFEKSKEEIKLNNLKIRYNKVLKI